MLPGNVLVLSADGAMAQHLQAGLAERRVRVHHAAWAPCCALPVVAHQSAADAVVADLDCPEPDCWRHATRLRRTFAALPVVFVFHALPDERRLRAWRPCGYLRKPFSVDELVRVLRELTPVAAS